MQQVIDAIVLEYGKLLLFRKKGLWILPGGKLEEGESDEACLRREVAEESSGTEIRNLQLYKEFTGISPNRRLPVRIRTYFADRFGQLGLPSGEIKETAWVPYRELHKYKLSDITHQIVRTLNEDGHYTRQILDKIDLYNI
ncbi:NUDIX hydrolase [Candidatus Pacearchaeota archaeon]|nr:NUDIX hydrolase [Candidatus Pacearchaeota archaeon]